MLQFVIYYVTHEFIEKLFWLSPLLGSIAIGVVGRMLLKNQPDVRIQLSKYSFVVGIISIIICLDCSVRFWPFSDLGFGHSGAPVWWSVLFLVAAVSIFISAGLFLSYEKMNILIRWGAVLSFSIVAPAIFTLCLLGFSDI